MPRWDINYDFKVNMDNELWGCMVQAEAHRMITARIPIPPEIASKFNRLNIIRQVKGTTGLEGNPMTEEEVAKAYDRFEIKGEVSERTEELSVHEKEVENALKVQQYIKEQCNAFGNPPVITELLIRELHQLTTDGLPTSTNLPGQYRTVPVHAGEYNAPEPYEIPQLMQEFVQVINRPYLVQGLGPVIRALVAHFYLITIHPFGDGNGRTSRALEALILYCSRYNARGFYSLANFFYRNRERYIQELQKARFQYNGDLTEFVRFSLKGLVTEISTIQDEILDFVKNRMFLAYLEERLTRKEIAPRPYTICDWLARYDERITVTQFKERKHPIMKGLYDGIKSDKTIERDLAALRDSGLVTISDDGVIRARISIMEQFEG